MPGRNALRLVRALTVLAGLSALPTAAALSVSPIVLATPIDCDRTCQTQVPNSVLMEMASGKVGLLPRAERVRATKDGVTRPYLAASGKLLRRFASTGST